MRFEDFPPIYKLADVAERWGCSEAHVRKLVEAGELRAFRIGKLWRVRGDAVDEFEAQAAVPRPPIDAPAGSDGEAPAILRSGRKHIVIPAAGEEARTDAAQAAARLREIMAEDRARTKKK